MKTRDIYESRSGAAGKIFPPSHAGRRCGLEEVFLALNSPQNHALRPRNFHIA